MQAAALVLAFVDEPTLDLMRSIFEQRIAFNQHLGLRIESVSADTAMVRIDMRDEFVGNYVRRIIHGGVISATLDSVAGLVAYLQVLKELQDASAQEKQDRLARIGTIDLRIDYLRPGYGDYFVASASVLRAGNRVAVIRAEMHNDAQALIAVGTCTYILV